MQNLDQMVVLNESSGDHPEGAVNVFTKFHGNLSDSCWDMSVWTEAVDWLLVPPNLLHTKYENL